MNNPAKDPEQLKRETEAYLARIRRTISESEALVAQAELRRAETDRMLASQGLTRKQVEALTFTPEQLGAVNEELRRRGMPQREGEWLHTTADSTDGGQAAEPNFEVADSQGDLENRRRKFNTMMQNFRL